MTRILGDDGQPIRLKCPKHGPITSVPCRACQDERRNLKAMERHARALEEAHGADARRGRQQIESVTKAGEMRRGQRKADHVTDTELVEQVRAFIVQGERPTKARQRVGKLHNIPLSTMKRRTRAL